MRIALLSDIHGNAIALDAVLAQAQSLGVEQYWILGDFAAIGPEPVAVLERAASLSHAQFTRGNTDRYVVTGDTPPPTLATVQTDPGLISTYAQIAASFAWTRGYVTACGWLEWFERLPLDIRLTAPNGVRILGVHATPGNDDGEGVHPGRSNAELDTLVARSGADVLFVGHTHEPMTRRVGSGLVVNLGSVSNPKPPDLRATYVLLELTQSGIEFEHRAVLYDRKAFIDSVRQSRHPATEFILSYQRGEQTGHDPHDDHTPLAIGEKYQFTPARH
jgi:predicted phosphodiesterase